MVSAHLVIASTAAATPGAYSDLSHVIAVVTITMAIAALLRLRPARRKNRGMHARPHDDSRTVPGRGPQAGFQMETKRK